MDLETTVRATVEGSRSAIGVGISCIIIGVIIGSVNMTSLGLNFGNLILRVVGDGHLFLGGLMVMIMSIILGMGVPGVAAYVIVYVVAVPVLRGVGATEMAANMFCLIYACLSNITPPGRDEQLCRRGHRGQQHDQNLADRDEAGHCGFHPAVLLPQ